jgi:putative tryptophan/tyrosine transport system substrate-binding protein
MIKRREFITLLGGAAAAWPLAAGAQQRAVPVIGWLSPASRNADDPRLHPFRIGLSERGYVEGRNVVIEYRWADGENNRIPALAADLVRRQVNVIVANSANAALAANAATTTIPIVFGTATDPVKAGLVASLSRPGGNLTGATSLNNETGPKRLELLHELVPTATNVAVLVDPASLIYGTQLQDLQAATRTLGLQLHVLRASTERDFDAAFATVVQLRAGALMINNDGFFLSRLEQLAALALRYGVPAIYGNRQFAAAGGLMSYGGSNRDQYRLVGVYSGRILKGEKPADLPVQQATKVELIINMKTAKEFGITFPTALLARADEVIE